MNKQRIVFMGTPDFAALVLEGLITNDYNVVGVVTQQDKKVGRKQILTFSPVKEVALKYNLPLFQPHKIRLDYQDILALNPDLIITCAYGQILPSEVLDYPKYKCINTHASLLPKYRGGAPIQWSIINGEKETGVSIMYMDEKMDEGDILYQRAIPIEKSDTSSSMFEKLAVLALDMLLEYLPLFFNGDIDPVKQDHSQATYAYNIQKTDEFISFDEDVIKVYNHIRGLLNNPGAYGIIDGKKIKFLAVDYSDKLMGKPGEFIGLVDKKIAIGCNDGTLLVSVLQQEGKKALSATDFFNGSGKNLVSKYYETKLSN